MTIDPASAALANTVIQGLMGAIATAQKYGAMMSQAAAEGRALNLDDLKAARAADDVAREELDAAIKTHGG